MCGIVLLHEELFLQHITVKNLFYLLFAEGGNYLHLYVGVEFRNLSNMIHFIDYPFTGLNFSLLDCRCLNEKDI